MDGGLDVRVHLLLPVKVNILWNWIFLWNLEILKSKSKIHFEILIGGGVKLNEMKEWKLAVQKLHVLKNGMDNLLGFCNCKLFKCMLKSGWTMYFMYLVPLKPMPCTCTVVSGTWQLNLRWGPNYLHHWWKISDQTVFNLLIAQRILVPSFFYLPYWRI